MLTIRLSFSAGALRQKSLNNFVEFNLNGPVTPYLRDYDAFNSDSAKMQEFPLHFSNFAGDSNAIPCSTHLLGSDEVSESVEFWMI